MEREYPQDVREASFQMYGWVTGCLSEGVPVSNDEVVAWLDRHPALTADVVRSDCAYLAFCKAAHWEYEYWMKSRIAEDDGISLRLDSAYNQAAINGNVASILDDASEVIQGRIFLEREDETVINKMLADLESDAAELKAYVESAKQPPNKGSRWREALRRIQRH